LLSIAQINFFHHYIHHRVLYITGSTGVGKSTQVPKLLLYALKAYEMKNDGTVVCTEPRIPPTKNNAERISEELGVPIVRVIPKSMEKEKTDN
jgi:HrpA-like RNA helicase